MLHLSDLQQTSQQDLLITVTHAYLHNLNLTIKHLTRLLKLRLRTESPESYSILNELNERMMPLIQSSTKVLQHNQEQLKAHIKQKELDERLIELETAYSNQIKQLTLENNQLQQDLSHHQEKGIFQNQYHIIVITFTALLRDSQELLGKLQQKTEYLQQQINIKEAETNKLNQEKDSMKKQQSQLQLLIKQVSTEKNTNDVDQRLNVFKQELDNLKFEYKRDLSDKDDKIIALQRELDLAQQELVLNSEYLELANTMKQSSDKKLNIDKLSSGKKKRSSSRTRK